MMRRYAPFRLGGPAESGDGAPSSSSSRLRIQTACSVFSAPTFARVVRRKHVTVASASPRRHAAPFVDP